MKICHLTSVHSQSDTRIFLKECTSLAKNHEVYLLVVNGKDDDLNGVKIRTVKVDFKNRFQRFTKAVDAIFKKALEINAEVYHLHDPELLRIAKKLKKSGKKVIYDAHEDLPRQLLSKPYLNKLILKLLSSIIEKYENKIASKLDAVVTATPFIKSRFIKYNTNTIDINNYPLIPNKNIVDIENKQDIICYVGGISRERGCYEILEILNYIDVRLIIAGNFYDDAIERDLKAHKNWSKVDFRGYVNREEVEQIYNQSKIGVVTLYPIINYIDALPVKLFEYMSFGLPVITSNIKLWESIVIENNCGLSVNPKNPKAIAEAINELLSNKEQQKQMSLNALKAIKEKYNWAQEEKKLIRLYEQIK
ncbi:MAG: glycosyltransferase family 4 protein [Vicingaceae bacterium]